MANMTGAMDAANAANEKPQREGTDDLSLLGSQGVRYPQTYDPSVLETFENKHPGNDYFVKFNCPEFTSLCPITGQPDFATIYIAYVPGERMVESKSLKLYLFSFRNHGDFHEDCVNVIMKDLIKLMDPKYIEVWGKFLPREGALQRVLPQRSCFHLHVRDQGHSRDRLQVHREPEAVQPARERGGREKPCHPSGVDHALAADRQGA